MANYLELIAVHLKKVAVAVLSQVFNDMPEFWVSEDWKVIQVPIFYLKEQCYSSITFYFAGFDKSLLNTTFAAATYATRDKPVLDMSLKVVQNCIWIKSNS